MKFIFVLSFHFSCLLLKELKVQVFDRPQSLSPETMGILTKSSGTKYLQNFQVSRNFGGQGLKV